MDDWRDTVGHAYHALLESHHEGIRSHQMPLEEGLLQQLQLPKQFKENTTTQPSTRCYRPNGLHRCNLTGNTTALDFAWGFHVLP